MNELWYYRAWQQSFPSQICFFTLKPHPHLRTFDVRNSVLNIFCVRAGSNWRTKMFRTLFWTLNVLRCGCSFTDSSKKQKTKMVWSCISQFSINKTGHFFHLTSLKFSDMKKADTFGFRNSLFMAFFSLQYSITRKVGCCFSVKKSWDFKFLLSFFLFFFKTCDHF